MIRGRQIGKIYRDRKVLENLAFSIPRGRITVLAGADGAGKSTLIKILLGLVKRDEGRVFLRGKDIGDDHTRISEIAGYMPERFSLYPDLTVEENLNFFADIQMVSLRRREKLKHRLLDKTGMLEFRRRRAGALSGGMKQKLSLSAILLSSPRIIFLDEPTTGVDPLSRSEFFTIIQELKAEGKTILLSTPYLDEAEAGDHIILLKKGKILREDEITELKKNFPLKLYRLLPRGNPIAAINRIRAGKNVPRHVHLKGRSIRLLKAEGETVPALAGVPWTGPEPASLEDIYLYYEENQGE